MTRAAEIVAVTAAAGGVGSVALQLAVDRGARVLAIAGTRNERYVRALGAAEFVDYRKGDWTHAVRERFQAGPPMQRLIAGAYSGGVPRRATLSAIAALVDAWRLRLAVDQVYALADAPSAQERATAGHVRGELVIDLELSHPTPRDTSER